MRNPRLLRTFAAGRAHRPRREPHRHTAAIRRAVEQSLVLEKELLVDPDTSPPWPTTSPTSPASTYNSMRGAAHNELTRYRYDITLYKTGITPHPLTDIPTRP